MVGFAADRSTPFHARRRLRLSIEWEGKFRDKRTLARSVDSSLLQLEQLGLNKTGTGAEESTADGHITAVILEPVGALAMIGPTLREALGQMGEADSIERFAWPRLVSRRRIQLNGAP